MTTPADVRKKLVEALQLDLVGFTSEDCLLPIAYSLLKRL